MISREARRTGICFLPEMTWNAEGILSSGRELALLSLLNGNDVDVGIITETEIPTSSHGDFNVEGYHTFLPVSNSELMKTAKSGVMVVVHRPRFGLI
jgi:hypothetical protein